MVMPLAGVAAKTDWFGAFCVAVAKKFFELLHLRIAKRIHWIDDDGAKP
jgi:hypothetical protein